MPRGRKYPQELIDRGVRLAIESGRPIRHVADDLGIHHETLRRAVRQAEADGGLRPVYPRVRSGSRSSSLSVRTSSCAARTRSSKRRACFLRPSSTQTERGERVYRYASRSLRCRADLPDPGRVGVRLLPPRHRARSERSVEDERLLGVIRETHKHNFEAYGYRKM